MLISPIVFCVIVPKVTGLKRKGVSVTSNVEAGLAGEWNFVAHARPPGAKFCKPNGKAALHVDCLKGPACDPGVKVVAPGTVNSSFTTTESGVVPDAVFAIKSEAEI